jgi:uncharacterized Ntn-hydrolase superfamily protein
MPHCRRILASSSLIPLLLVTTPAGATYSIVATDQATQAVGGAVTSCVGSSGVLVVYRPAVGKGGINAQALPNTMGRDRGVQLLNMDMAPADIIADITRPTYDQDYNERQYGIADLQGRAAAFTGTGTSVALWRGSKQGTLGTYTYSIQGNVLTSGAVVDQAETAFRGGGCDLAEKLMLALEGGAENGEGDDRCRPSIPSDAASIEVDLVGQTAGSYLRLSNASGSGQNAVTQLRSQFNTWRQTHGCMQLDGGAPDAGPKDASVSDATADRRDGGDASGDGDASDGSGGTAGTGGSAGSAGAAGSSGSGGFAGSAGAAGSSGASGSGGSAGAGGATGGASGSGGSSGKGGGAGAVGTGGSAGSGMAGATGSGGASGSGGTTGTGGASGSAGSGTTGGRSGSGTGGGSSGSAGSSPDDGGCSCRIGRSESASTATFVLAGLAFIVGDRRRRSRRRPLR